MRICLVKVLLYNSIRNIYYLCHYHDQILILNSATVAPMQLSTQPNAYIVRYIMIRSSLYLYYIIYYTYNINALLQYNMPDKTHIIIMVIVSISNFCRFLFLLSSLSLYIIIFFSPYPTERENISHTHASLYLISLPLPSGRQQYDYDIRFVLNVYRQVLCVVWRFPASQGNSQFGSPILLVTVGLQ